MDEEELKQVYRLLKTKSNLSAQDISDRIGCNFKNNLYNQTTFSKSSFNRLEALYGDDIGHEKVNFRNGSSYEKRITDIEYDENLAEFAGLLLGDGHIDKRSYNDGDKYVTNYLVELIFNREEKELIERALTLFESVSGRKPTKMYNKHDKGVNIRLYSLDLVELLEEAGLEPGNKKKNQVGIPSWVKQNKDFQISCLRGLIDTDGTIYYRGENDRVVQFKNASGQLLQDFKEVCDNLGIKTSKGGHRTVQVAAQDDVDKFIRLIDPIKNAG